MNTMDRPFFIMLYNQRGDYAEPVVDYHREVKFWRTKEEAKQSMLENMPESFGFEVHEMGKGDR